MEATSVRVAVRVRPLSSKEAGEGARESVLVSPESATVCLGSGKTEKSFAFDFVLGTESSTGDLYEQSVAPMLAKALDGYHVTLFAYGQTGAWGPPEAPPPGQWPAGGRCQSSPCTVL